jgi:hypothetical protein
MRWSTAGACLALALASALPFQPWAPSRSGSSFFEITAESDEAGVAKLYYDIGRGIGEGDTAVQPVFAARTSLLRFALPRGKLVGLRLEPLDRDFRMTLSGARIVDASGRELARFGPQDFQRANQILPLVTRDGKLEVTTNLEASHPLLILGLAGPVRLPQESWWKGAAGVFAGLLALLYLLEAASRSPSLRLPHRARAAWARAYEAPGRAILAVALLATLAANYPVIFGGKSLVSPNLGTALLYGENPWVPGLQSVERGNSNGADIDAFMWDQLPFSMIQHASLLRDHELPLWNRYNSAGAPLLGQGQSCLGDPLHLIPVLANGAPWAWDAKFLIGKWLFACGIGFCVWRLTRHLPASLVMAASAQFIGFFVYRISHPAVFSFCYSPWILYAWMRIAGSASARGAVLGMAALVGVNLVELCSGTVKEAYMLLLSMNFSGMCLLLASEGPPARKLRLLGGLCAAGAVFALISSPAWYTFLQALGSSYTSYDAPQAFQLQPGMLVGLFDEVFYRPFQALSNVVNPSANFLVLIGLLWLAVSWRPAMANRALAALFFSSLPALMLAFGVISPGLIVRVPFLRNILHVDNTFSCVLIVLYTVLAGAGLRQAWDTLGSREGARDAKAVLILLAGLCAAYVGTAQSVVRSAYAAQTWGRIVKVGPFVNLYGCSLLLASALLLWAIHRARSRGSWTPALAVLSLLALAALHWRLGLQEGTAFPDYVIMPTDRVDLKASSPTLKAVLDAGSTPYRTVGFVDNFFPGWTAAYGMEGIGGPDALINRYYREFMDASGMERVWDWRYKLEDSDLNSIMPVLDVLGTRFYLDYPGGPRPYRLRLRPFLSADMEAYESPAAWPRAFFTDSAAVYGEVPQLVSWIKAGDGRPFAAVQHDDWAQLDPLPRVSGDLASRKVSPATGYRLTANTTSFTVSATGPGFIVLTEAYEPGNFRATVNGAPVPYLRVNHAFKGIYVGSAGTYRVEFAYWPRSLSAALAACAVGLLLSALGICLAVFRLPRAAGPACI